MATTSRLPAPPRFRTGHRAGPQRTSRDTPRARFLRALVAHAGLLRAYLHREPSGGEDGAPAGGRAGRGRRAERRGRTVPDIAIRSLVQPHGQLLLTTWRAGVAIPTEPGTGAWAIVHAGDRAGRRALRRRWFPWTLRAWLTTAADGAIALFSWGPSPKHAGGGPRP